MKRANLNNHEFAAYLRKRGAESRFVHEGCTCRWLDQHDEIVAIAVYDNSACTRITFIEE